MKTKLIILGCIFSMSAHAELIGQGTHQTMLSSKDADVIMCTKSEDRMAINKCDLGFGTFITPQEYAGRAGYKVIRRQGILVSRELKTQIVMEVLR